MRGPRQSLSAAALACGVLVACAAPSACDRVLGIPDRQLDPNVVCDDNGCQCAAGSALCDSGCTPLDTDGANCGACGHSCLGGACQDGQCQPVDVGAPSVVSLLASDGAVYIGSCNVTASSCTSESILQVIPSSCTPPSSTCMRGLWKPTDDTVFAIGASGDSIFWADKPYGSMPGSIYKSLPGFGDDGGAGGGGGAGAETATILTTITDGTVAQSLAASPTMVYWVSVDPSSLTYGPLHRVSVMGGPPQQISPGPVDWIAADSSNAYYVDENKALYAVPHTGASTSTLLASKIDPGPMVVDGQTIYIGGDMTIQAAPITGGPPEILVHTSSTVKAIALDATYLYWGEENGTIQRVPRAGGGSPVTLVKGASIGLMKMVVDDRAVYFSGGLAFGPLYMIAK